MLASERGAGTNEINDAEKKMASEKVKSQTAVKKDGILKHMSL